MREGLPVEGRSGRRRHRLRPRRPALAADVGPLRRLRRPLSYGEPKKKILVSFFSCRQLVNILTLGLRLQKQVVVWAVLVVVGREDGRPVRLCWSGVDKINCSSGGVGVGGGGGVGGGETATAVDVLVDNPPLSLSHGSPTAGERRSPFSKQEKRTKRKGIACLVLNGLARWRHCAVF